MNPYKFGYNWLADPKGVEYYNCQHGNDTYELNGTVVRTTKTYNEGGSIYPNKSVT